MAIPGVYTSEEEEMLAKWEAKAESRTGPLGDIPKGEMAYPVLHRTLGKDLMLYMNSLIDFWNPLWHDENYARNTRWGEIIGPPMLTYVITFGSHMAPTMEVPPSLGEVPGEGVGFMLGTTFEWFKPMRVNDSYTVSLMRAELEDVTKADESGPRTFKIKSGAKIYNQNKELVHARSHRQLFPIFPKMKRTTKITPKYVYTKEELEAIDRIGDEEEIRGAKRRYWEDVKVGDKLQPIVHGPITPWDIVIQIVAAGIAVLPMREVRKRTPGWTHTDPATGVTHKTIEMHVSEYSAEAIIGGSPPAVGSEIHLSRLMTNWMGDDGFLRKMTTKGLGMDVVGDTWIGRGKVAKKYIANGEHLVDLVVWVDNIRGNVSQAAYATVSLPSYKDFKL